MTNDAKVRLRLDMGQALAQMRQFAQKVAATAKRVGSSVKSNVGGALGTVGIGAGIGAGLAAARGAISSGVGDVVGEYTGPLGAQFVDAFTGGDDAIAKAAKSSRAATERILAAQVYRSGSTDSAVGFFNNAKERNEEIEIGRSMIRQDPRFYAQEELREIREAVRDGVRQGAREGSAEKEQGF